MSESGLHCEIPQSLGDIQTSGQGISLRFAFRPPEISTEPSDRAMVEGNLPSPWLPQAREARYDREAGLGIGQVVLDRFTLNGFEIIREVFQADDGSCLAIRGTVCNRSDMPLHLGEWLIFSIRGQDGVALAGEDIADCMMFRHGRHKNDQPVAVTLHHADESWQAAADRRGHANPSQALTLDSDPFAIFIGPDEDSPALLLGFLDETTHLGRIEITMDASHKDVTALRAICEFDGCLLQPGSSRQTSWLMLGTQVGWETVLDTYLEAIADLHHVPEPPSPPPSVYCTWSFYGSDILPEHMNHELDWFEAHRWPIDVFQLDEGWQASFGDWYARPPWEGASPETFVERITHLGYRPGIWTAPLLASPTSQLAAEHPQWLLRNGQGERIIFPMNGEDNWVLDPTHPEVEVFIDQLYRRLTHEWGYTYHKIDFMRASFLVADAVYYDPTATRAQAYRHCLRTIRDACGPASYLLICGALYLPGIGLCDGQRAGSDVKGKWLEPHADVRIRQNLLRTWMNRLWHTDPDSLMIRRRTEPFGCDPHQLSLGLFTDEEARTLATNQYLGGGLVCFTERMSELDADRAALYRHCIPSAHAPATPIDLFEWGVGLPSLYRTQIQPQTSGLEPWYTLAIINWWDKERTFELPLDEALLGVNAGLTKHFLVWEFWEQRFVGCFEWQDMLPEINVPPHGTRTLRITPWDGVTPMLIGTDCHLSMGGTEVSDWKATPTSIQAQLVSTWGESFHLWLALPQEDSQVLVKVHKVAPGRWSNGIA